MNGSAFASRTSTRATSPWIEGSVKGCTARFDRDSQDGQRIRSPTLGWSSSCSTTLGIARSLQATVQLVARPDRLRRRVRAKDVRQTVISRRCKNVLINGPSGVGKSSLLANIPRRVSNRSLRGFVSQAIFEGDQRIGWRLDNLRGDGDIFIHPDIDSPYRFREYGVNLELLDRLVDSELCAEADLYLIDEIGKVAPMSPRFVAAVEDLLGSQSYTVSAVHSRAPGFAAEVRARPDVTSVEVGTDDADALIAEILEWRGWQAT
jgi:nucleoside-triphosphatase THEP1